MSLARAFTTRRSNKMTDANTASYIGRAASQRAPNSKPIERSQISLPVALISTTNMLSYEAPDIQGTQRITDVPSASSSPSLVSDTGSDDESDRRSSTSGQSHRQDFMVIDEFSADSPELNHLSCYFKPAVSTQQSARSPHSPASRPSIDSPVVPQRAPSHSIKAHVMSHKRSVSRMAQSAPERKNTRESVDMFTRDVDSAPTSHPFGKELEQLNEAAEEFGHAVRDAEADADVAVMKTKGLVRFCANEYLLELSGLYNNAFEDEAAAYQPMVWI